MESVELKSKKLQYISISIQEGKCLFPNIYNCGDKMDTSSKEVAQTELRW